MSTSTLNRRLSFVERTINPANTIAPDQRDPEFVEFLQYIYRERFRMEMVPLGVSCKEFLKEAIASAQGTGLQPVKMPPGGWPKGE